MSTASEAEQGGDWQVSGVSIVRDARSPRGYRVRTAYPRNSDPK